MDLLSFTVGCNRLGVDSIISTNGRVEMIEIMIASTQLQVSKMTKLLLIALCLVLWASAIQTPAQTIVVTTGYQSRYDMTLALGQTATFTFTTLSTSGAAPTVFGMELFEGATSRHANAAITLPAVGSTATETYTVAAPAAAGTFTLHISTTGTTTGALAGLNVIKIDVAGTTTASLLANRLEVLKPDTILKLAYLAAAGSIVVTTTTILTNAVVNLYTVPSVSTLAFTPAAAISTNVADTGSNLIRTYSSLAAGYYALQITGTAAGSFKYTTDTYPCPSFKTYTTIDTFQVFETCLFESTIFAAAPYADGFPLYALTGITKHEVLEIEVNLPDWTTLGDFTLNIMTSAGVALTRQQTPFGTSHTVTAIISKTFWTAPAAGDYYLQVTTGTAVVAAQKRNWYYLNVYKANGGTVVQGIDIIRDAGTQFIKVITTTVTSNIYLKSTLAAGTISLFPVSTTAGATLHTIGTAETGTATGTDYKFAAIGAGSYIAIFDYTTAQAASATIGIQTQSITCPYDSSSTYTDTRNVFEGCTGSTTAATLPVTPTASTTISTYGNTIKYDANLVDTDARYKLDPIAVGDVLTFTINFRLPTSAAPTSYQIILQTAIDTAAGTQPTGFNAATTITESSDYSLTATFTATAAGAMYVKVVQSAAANPASFRIYQLTVTSTSTTFVAVSASGILRNQPTGAANDDLFNLIYLSAASTVVLRNTLGLANIVFFPMDTTNYLLTPYTVSTAVATALTDIGASGNSYAAVAMGWHGVQFQYDGLAANAATGVASTSYQSNAYSCPSSLTDPTGAFNPCASSSSDSSSSNTVIIVVAVVVPIVVIAVIIIIVVVCKKKAASTGAQQESGNAIK